MHFRWNPVFGDLSAPAPSMNLWPLSLLLSVTCAHLFGDLGDPSLLSFSGTQQLLVSADHLSPLPVSAIPLSQHAPVALPQLSVRRPQLQQVLLKLERVGTRRVSVLCAALSSSRSS